MRLEWKTRSFCSTCYREIPAVITADSAGYVVMDKACPVHSNTRSVVENDPFFYTTIRQLQSPSIYSGYFIDVTRRCQLRCAHCYYPLEKADPDGEFSLLKLLSECETNAALAPFIFTGGEPTLHPQFIELVKEAREFGPVEVLTNGVKLADPDFYDKLIPLITTPVQGVPVANLNLSIHAAETGAWKSVLSKCHSDGVRVESALIVIDSEESFIAAVRQIREEWPAMWSLDTVLAFRIKAATKLWAEGAEPSPIFCSDMLRWLEQAGYKPKFILSRDNKVPLVNVQIDTGQVLMLVSWNTVANVDLNHINCAPYYRAHNGEICNFVTASLINEGMSKNWCKGEWMGD